MEVRNGLAMFVSNFVAFAALSFELGKMLGLELGRAEFLLWAASGGAAVRYSGRGRGDVVALGVFRWGLHAG